MAKMEVLADTDANDVAQDIVEIGHESMGRLGSELVGKGHHEHVINPKRATKTHPVSGRKKTSARPL